MKGKRVKISFNLDSAAEAPLEGHRLCASGGQVGKCATAPPF